jgi:hypothetical protein
MGNVKIVNDEGKVIFTGNIKNDLEIYMDNDNIWLLNK